MVTPKDTIKELSWKNLYVGLRNPLGSRKTFCNDKAFELKDLAIT